MGVIVTGCPEIVVFFTVGVVKTRLPLLLVPVAVKFGTALPPIVRDSAWAEAGIKHRLAVPVAIVNNNRAFN
jgi:hypothetical protein